MKFLGAWVSAIALFAVPAFAGQNIIRNYNTARDKFFYKKLYPHGGWTIYCGKRWRTKRGLNVEHVYPASWMAKHLGCGARRQCRTDSQRFNFMEADLHNLYPSLAHINQARSNYKYSLLPNTPKFVEWCDFKVKKSKKLAHPAGLPVATSPVQSSTCTGSMGCPFLKPEFPISTCLGGFRSPFPMKTS